jgi:arylsulfatase A-like enzyme
MKKVFFMLLILILFIFLLFIFFFKEEKIRIDHIFLITIDTLRADHLSCYGYPRKTSSFLDSLAKKGVLFEKAISQSATTCPSHASIFTGLYPIQHKVLSNAYVLDDSYTTLAEILREKGIRTAAFTSTDIHFQSSNLDQGFEFYEEPIDIKRTYGYKYRPAKHTINNAIIWLYNFDPKEKLFLWVHLFDPHLPYKPPRKHYKTIDKQMTKKDFLEYLHKYNFNLEIFDNDPNKMYRYITNYDAEIKYVDEELKRFNNVVKNMGLNKNSLWIITSDHGEGLGQHDWLKHGKLLYQEEIHIPLIFYFSGSKIKPVRIMEVIENSDIFSTVLEIFKVKKDKKDQKDVKAISLWTKIKKPASSLQRKFAFSERRHYIEREKIKKNYRIWEKAWEEGNKYSIQNRYLKYIFRTKLEDELYHMREDPYELSNLIKSSRFAEEKTNLKNKLLEIISERAKYKNLKLQEKSRKIIEKLKSLGYVR